MPRIVSAVKFPSGDLLVFDAVIVQDSPAGSVADDLRRRFRGRTVTVYPGPGV